MITRLLGLLSFLLFVSSSLLGQYNEWKTIFSPYHTTSIVRFQNTIYAGTKSGLIWFDQSSPENTHFLSKENGLSSVNITNLLVDSVRNQLIITFANGDFQFMNLTTQQFTTISDIRLYPLYTDKRINSISIRNDNLWMGTAFGLVSYNLQKKIFEFDLSQMQTFNNMNVSGISFFNDSVFVSTGFGLFKSPLSNPNFKNAASWTKINSVTGNLTSLSQFNEKLYIGTTTGIRTYKNGTITNLTTVGSVNVRKMMVGKSSENETRLYILTSTQLLGLKSDDSFSVLNNSAAKPNNLWSSDGVTFITTDARGVIRNSDQGNEELKFTGVFANAYRTLSFADKGSFWGTTGVGSDYSTYFDGEKHNRIDSKMNGLLGAYQHMVAKRIKNEWWLGTWGNGLFIFDDNETSSRISVDNSNFVGIDVDASYTVIVDIDEDLNGDVWFVCFSPVDNKPLRVKRKNKSWEETEGLGFQNRLFGEHWFDSQYNHWVTLLDGASIKKGLLVVNDNGTPENTADDKTLQINTATGLPSDDVNDIVFDKNGAAWVATSSGLSVIYNAYYIFSAGSLSISPIYSIENQKVYSLAIDANGNVWASTSSGISVISSETQKIIAVYTEQNSSLLNNISQKIIYQPNNGKMFALTSYGVSIMQTSSVETGKTTSEPNIYPNPFVLNKNDGIWIEGLSTDSKIKIIAADGNIVRSLPPTKSKVGFWDGTNERGEKVGSGVYLVYLMDKENKSASVGKVLVIK